MATQEWDRRREIDGLRRSWRREFDRRSRRLRWDVDDRLRRARRQSDGAPAPLRPAGLPRPPMRPGPASPSAQRLDDVVLTAGAVALPLVTFPLAVGHVAALVFGGGWPRYRLADVPGILGRFVADPGDPAAAWGPVNSGATVPGPVAWWGTFLVMAAVVGVAGVAAVRAYARRDRAHGGATGGKGRDDGWADARERHQVEARRGDDRPHLVVGTRGGRTLGLHDRHSLLVVGSAHSGKTSGVSIPTLLEWEGPAIVASSKGHLVDQTIGWRSRRGDIHLFDPAGMTPYHSSGWSPLATCSTWQEALRTASDLAAAARASAGSDLDGLARRDLWRHSLALAPYLLAATADRRPLTDLLDWVAAEDRDEVVEVLEPVDRLAMQAHMRNCQRPDPDRSDFLRSVHAGLGAYNDPAVAATTDRHEIVPAELLDGGHHTLYLTAPEYDQARFRMLNATILRQVLAAAYEHSAARSEALQPPLLLLLDQVVGLAAVDDLAAVASTGAARGVQVVSVFQDMSQIEDHYGDTAHLLVKNHRAKLVLPDGADAVGGDDHGHLLAPDMTRELDESEAALLYGTLRPIRLRLRAWFRDEELRRRVHTPQDAIDPAEPWDRSPGPLEPKDRTRAWLGRGRRRRPGPEGPGIPLDTTTRAYKEVFGWLDEGPETDNVTPISELRDRFRR